MGDGRRRLMASVAVSYVQSVLDYVGQAGGNPDAVLDAAGVLPDALANSAARVEAGLFARLFDVAADQLDTPDLGLAVGAAIRPGHYGVLGYVVMSCETLGEALTRHLRYQRLVADIGEAQLLGLPDGQLRLMWVTSKPPTRQLAEHNLAGWVSYARWITGQPLSPTRVLLPHCAPADRRAHDALFACPISFDAGMTALEFPGAYLGLRMTQADPGLREQMDRYARRLLTEYAQSRGAAGQLRHWLRRHLAAGDAQLATAAAALEVAPRTLQRRLAGEGWTFNRLVDDTRRQLALELFTEPGMTGAELAFMLGFSDQTAFNRAFRRWFDMTPGEARSQPERLLASRG